MKLPLGGPDTATALNSLKERFPNAFKSLDFAAMKRNLTPQKFCLTSEMLSSLQHLMQGAEHIRHVTRRSLPSLKQFRSSECSQSVSKHSLCRGGLSKLCTISPSCH